MRERGKSLPKHLAYFYDVPDKKRYRILKEYMFREDHKNRKYKEDVEAVVKADKYKFKDNLLYFAFEFDVQNNASLRFILNSTESKKAEKDLQKAMLKCIFFEQIGHRFASEVLHCSITNGQVYEFIDGHYRIVNRPPTLHVMFNIALSEADKNDIVNSCYYGMEQFGYRVQQVEKEEH